MHTHFKLATDYNHYLAVRLPLFFFEGVLFLLPLSDSLLRTHESRPDSAEATTRGKTRYVHKSSLRTVFPMPCGQREAPLLLREVTRNF